MINRLRGQLVEKDMEGVVIDVAGVGYRASASASTLWALSPQEIAESVGRGDVVKLASVPGLGRKTAERLVLELRGKNLAAFDPGILGGNVGGPYVEAREALAALGYSIEEAEKALKDVPPQDSAQRYVKEALRRIGGRC